jgi:hypothetical protein
LSTAQYAENADSNMASRQRVDRIDRDLHRTERGAGRRTRLRENRTVPASDLTKLRHC